MIIPEMIKEKILTIDRFLIVVALIVLTCSCHREKQATKPNILFLFADDQRAGTINALGNPEILTPTIDGLVNSGLAFTNAYIMGGSSAAVCAPSRAMLLTGRNLYSIEKQGWAANISEKHETLPESFRKAGYETFGTGKQHNGKAVFFRGFSSGNEIFFGGMSDHWNVPVFHFDGSGKYEKRIPFIKNPGRSNKVDYTSNCDHMQRGKHSSELFADAAIEFLKNRDSDKAFFAYISFTAPHDPRSMPEEYLKLYDTTNISLPPNYAPQHPFDFGEYKIRDEMLASFPRTKAEVKIHLRDYYAMITHMDSEIGKIINALKESGEYENTIIVFSADNGLAVGQHGMMGKQNLYEHSIGVPLVICGPGIPRKEKREAFCYLFDLFPTLCQLCEIDIPESIQGKSMLPEIYSDNIQQRKSMLYGYKEFMRSFRNVNLKLIEYLVDGKRNSQLFHLEDDPFEQNNLVLNKSFSWEFETMKKNMLREMKSLNDTNDIYKVLMEEI